MRGLLVVLVATAVLWGGAAARDAAAAAPSPRPAPVAATVAGRVLTVTWNQELARVVSAADFTARRDGLELTVRTARARGSSVVLGLAETAYADDLVDVRYLPTTERGVVDRHGRSARPSRWLRAANHAAPGCAPWFEPDQAIGEGIPLPGINLRSVGRLRLLVIPVEFNEGLVTPNPETVRSRLVERLSYLERESRGRLSLTVETLPAWTNIGQPAERYLDPGPRIAVDALAAVDRAVDFRLYDAVIVVTAPSLLALPTYALPRLGFLGGEGYVNSVAVISARHISSYAPPHELSHLFGLPDLYVDAVGGTDFSPVGSWDLMSDGNPSLLVWHRYKLGWLDPPELRCVRAGSPAREVELAPLTHPGVHGVIVRLSRTTALVLENRQRASETFPGCPEGVLAYVFDSHGWSGFAPLEVLPALRTPRHATCGHLADSPYALGDGRRASFSFRGFNVTLLAQRPNGSIRVRVSRD